VREPTVRFVPGVVVPDMFEFAREKGRAIFDLQSYHTPTFLLEVAGGVCVVVDDWADAREKHATVAAVRHVCARASVKRIAVVVEGWMVSRDRRTTDLRGVVPSEASDREEVLWVVSQEAGEPQRAGYYTIRRESESVARCDEWHDIASEQAVGIFDEMVTQSRTQH
jgi:hypothetical protein